MIAKTRIRQNRISFYTNDDELKLLNLSCKKYNLTRSEFLRKCLVADNKVGALQEKEKVFKENFYQLQQLGKNINQLTKALNSLTLNAQREKDKKLVFEVYKFINYMGLDKKISKLLKELSTLINDMEV